MSSIAPVPGSSTIELALKIWRYDAETGEKELKRYEVEAPDWVAGAVRSAMHGLAAAPLLALMPVANVFIYLNLRYEQAR